MEGEEEVQNKQTKRPRWDRSEIDRLEKHFFPYIQQKKYPTGTQISRFILKYDLKRTTSQIRSKLQNMMRK
jgi:hypothetical protein